MIKSQRVVHFTIPVTDLDCSLKFYRDLLGCELVHSNPLMHFMKCGDSHFVLTKMQEHAPANPPGGTLNHHAFAVAREDFDAAMDEMRRAGVECLSYEDRGHRMFPGRHAYFHDPDRNAIELIDLHPDDDRSAEGPASLRHAIEKQRL
jgi:catechol 2,3-dioxygenase-like lactoylglutathione lyase family enzyme